MLEKFHRFGDLAILVVVGVFLGFVVINTATKEGWRSSETRGSVVMLGVYLLATLYIASVWWRNRSKGG